MVSPRSIPPAPAQSDRPKNRSAAPEVSPEMGWLPPSSDGIELCQDGGVENPQSRKDDNRDERYDDWD